MIRYQVEILKGINHWELVSEHAFFKNALDEYCELEDLGQEARIMCSVSKSWQVL